MSPVGHDAFTTIIVHACDMIRVHAYVVHSACRYFKHSTCTMIIRHVWTMVIGRACTVITAQACTIIIEIMSHRSLGWGVQRRIPWAKHMGMEAAKPPIVRRSQALPCLPSLRQCQTVSRVSHNFKYFQLRTNCRIRKSNVN